MPHLTRYDLHQNVPLTNFGLAYMGREGAIGAAIPTPVPVKKKTDSFYKMSAEDFHRNQAVAVGDSTPIPKIDFSASTDTYTCTRWGIGAVITEEQKANADDWWQLLQRKTILVTKAIELSKEIRLAALLFNTTTWTGATLTTTVGVPWTDPSAVPLADILTAWTKPEDLGRPTPNTVIFGTSPWRNFFKHTNVVRGLWGEGADVKGQGTPVTPSIVASYFSQFAAKPVKVFIGRQMYETSRVGGTASKSAIWGSYVWVGNIADAPDGSEPTAVAAFRQQYMIDTYFVRELRADVIDGLEVTTEKVCDSSCAHLLKGM